MKFTVQKKILCGFGAVLTLVVLVTISNLVSMARIADDQKRLIELRLPSVMAGAELTDGMHLSLAGLRGYMILGSDPDLAKKFKAERQAGWALIDQSIRQMDGFAKQWTNPNAVKQLKGIKTLAEEFRSVQQEVENIANTPANIPSIDLLNTEAAPRAGKIMQAITAMIDAESRLAATPERKALLKLLADSRGSFAISLANMRAFLLTGDAQYKQKFDAKWAINEARYRTLSKPTVTRLFNAQQARAWKTYKTLRSEFSPLPPRMFTLRSGKDWNLANYWLGSKAAPKAKAMIDLVDKMRASQEQLSQVDKGSLINDAQTMKAVMIAGVLVTLVCGILISLWVSRIISLPLLRVVKRAEAIGSGDLSGAPLQVTGNDELADLTVSVNTMTTSLQDMVNQILDSSQQLGNSSEELSAVTTQTSASLLNQHSQTDSVATAMNQMTATVQEVAINISNTAQAAEEANLQTAEGRKMVDDAIKAIQQLAGRIEGASGIIAKVEQDSKEISSVMEVIRSIADQTNLLALNAAIEAARAGEQGRGFAVVADEVRALASRTQVSTEEINQVIEKLQIGSREAVEVMNKSHEEAQAAVTQAAKAGASLSDISASVDRINDMSIQIASAAEQQIATSEEINCNVINISQVAQETSTGAQQTAIASEELARLASKLQLCLLVSACKLINQMLR
ncbi:MAG: methyl-accepting chemotaxis protein [Pseudohongiellaceae bacterium]|jgi:methyl-accepting chemotaxis protein